MSASMQVIPRRLDKTYRTKNTRVLSASIIYPQFVSPAFRYAAQSFNERIRQRVDAFFARGEELSQLAAQDLRQRTEQGFPFIPYEAQTMFRISYNMNCVLSLYTDAYEFTGGAHGSTLRTSDTRNLQTARPYALSDFFAPGTDVRATVLAEVDRQIARQIEEESGVFFDDVYELASAAYNENSYYLTPAGIVVYFQYYDIAPHSSGIVEFVIPFTSPGALPPVCSMH